MKMTKLVSMSTIAATVLSGLVLAASPVQAATWTARKPAEIQITKGQKVYTIQWGDTLWAISQRTNITVAKLAQLNGVANPSFIMTGATLTLDWSRRLRFRRLVLRRMNKVQRPHRLNQPVQLLHRHKPRIRILLPAARNQDQRMLIHQVVRIPALVQLFLRHRAVRNQAQANHQHRPVAQLPVLVQTNHRRLQHRQNRL